MILIFLISALNFFSISHATDMGFRFESGFCHKNRQPGLNPFHYGECGNLTGAKIINRKFLDENFKASTYNSAYIYVTTFKKTDLSHVSIRRGIMMQSKLKDVTAKVFDLRGSHIKGVDFINTDLTNLLASGTRFVKVDFKNCNLTQANFWGSSLQETNFEGSDLSGANLENTFLLFTRFKGAKFSDTTKLPFTQKEAIKRGMIKVDDELPEETD